MGMKIGNITSNGATCQINGKTYCGNNITMKNGEIYVDGQLVGSEDELGPKLEIIIKGDLMNLSVEGNVEVHGMDTT